jgi:hypothetical protein
MLTSQQLNPRLLTFLYLVDCMQKRWKCHKWHEESKQSLSFKSCITCHFRTNFEVFIHFGLRKLFSFCHFQKFQHQKKVLWRLNNQSTVFGHIRACFLVLLPIYVSVIISITAQFSSTINTIRCWSYTKLTSSLISPNIKLIYLSSYCSIAIQLCKIKML